MSDHGFYFVHVQNFYNIPSLYLMDFARWLNHRHPYCCHHLVKYCVLWTIPVARESAVANLISFYCVFRVFHFVLWFCFFFLYIYFEYLIDFIFSVFVFFLCDLNANLNVIRFYITYDDWKYWYRFNINFCFRFGSLKKKKNSMEKRI